MSETPPPSETARSYRAARPKVPPFARFEGTSAWKKERRRAREYARFKEAARQAAPKA